MHLWPHPQPVTRNFIIWTVCAATGHAAEFGGYEVRVIDDWDGDLWLFADHSIAMGVVRGSCYEEAADTVVNEVLPDADRGLLRAFADNHPDRWLDGLLPPHCHYRTGALGRHHAIRSRIAQAPPAGSLQPLTPELMASYQLGFWVSYRDIWWASRRWVPDASEALAGGSRSL